MSHFCQKGNFFSEHVHKLNHNWCQCRIQKEYCSVGAGTRGNPIIPNHIHPHPCICNCMPVDGHGKHMPKIISFMTACNGQTRRVFLTSRPVIYTNLTIPFLCQKITSKLKYNFGIKNVLLFCAYILICPCLSLLVIGPCVRCICLLYLSV